MNKKDALVMQLEAQLDEWSAELDELNAKTKQLEANAKFEQDKQIKKLQGMEKSARQKLDELKGTSDDKLGRVEDEVREYWMSLGREIKAFDTRL